jgi:hypothetical protein
MEKSGEMRRIISSMDAVTVTDSDIRDNTVDYYWI